MWRSARTADRARYRPGHRRLEQFADQLGRRRPPQYLVEGALPRRLVRPPAQKACAMAEAAAGDMVIADLDDQLRPQGLPFARAFGAPSAGTTWCIAGKTGRLDQPLELLGQPRAVEIVQRSGKADMVELARVIVETEQKRADEASLALVAELADDAIRRALCFFTLSMARSPSS